MSIARAFSAFTDARYRFAHAWMPRVLQFSAFITTVTFGPDVTSASYSVPIVDDSIIEDTETFTATLSTTESNVSIGDDTATVTILDDDGELFTIILVACKEEY